MTTGRQLRSIVLIKMLKQVGKIEVLTPILIGGSDEMLSIGSAADKSFIRDSVEGYPYIPGSSLKGKLRSSLEETTKGKIIDNEPHGCGKSTGGGERTPIEVDCLICKIFGPHKTAGHDFGPTRLLVRDALFAEESKGDLKQAQQTGRPYYELKTENWTDRRTRVAGSPRTFERVPRGAKFDIELVLRIYEVDGRRDDEAKFKEFISRGLRLVEESYLGSSGSRGYGKVKFALNEWQEIII